MNDAENSPQKRVEAVRSVVESLACIPDKVKRDIYIQECSNILGVSEEVDRGGHGRSTSRSGGAIEKTAQPRHAQQGP